MMHIECNPKYCPCGPHCKNIRIQKRQISKVFLFQFFSSTFCFSFYFLFVFEKYFLKQVFKVRPFRTVNRGWGLMATKKINEGDFIIEYVGNSDSIFGLLFIECLTFVGEIISYDEAIDRVSQECGEDNYYVLDIDSRY
jgi:hypothetical protein